MSHPFVIRDVPPSRLIFGGTQTFLLVIDAEISAKILLTVGADSAGMSSKQRGYKSTEKVADSSSDEESVHSLRDPDDSASAPSRSPSPSDSDDVSSPPSSPSISQARTPSPDPDSYQYTPPTTHQLSTSKDTSAMPNMRTGDELFLLRIPRGVPLNHVQFNFRKRKVRIGEEEWKLVDNVTGNVQILQPVENSDKYEFGVSLLRRR